MLYLDWSFFLLLTITREMMMKIITMKMMARRMPEMIPIFPGKVLLRTTGVITLSCMWTVLEKRIVLPSEWSWTTVQEMFFPLSDILPLYRAVWETVTSWLPGVGIISCCNIIGSVLTPHQMIALYQQSFTWLAKSITKSVASWSWGGPAQVKLGTGNAFLATHVNSFSSPSVITRMESL